MRAGQDVLVIHAMSAHLPHGVQDCDDQEGLGAFSWLCIALFLLAATAVAVWLRRFLL